MSGPVELLGREDRITWTGDRLRVEALTEGDGAVPDAGTESGRLRLDAVPADLLEPSHGYVTGPPVDGRPGAPEHLVLTLALVSPDHLVDGRPREHRPLHLLLPLEAVDAVPALVEDVRRAVLAARRLPVPPPPVGPPHDPAALAPAVARMADRRGAGPALDALAELLGGTDAPHEPVDPVLEVAAAGPDALVAVTWSRVLFLDPARGVAHALPLAAVIGARVTGPPQGTDPTGPIGPVAGMTLDDGLEGVAFAGLDPRDATRLVGAVHHRLGRLDVDGAVGPRRPGSAELFERWQLLVERRALGMVPEEEFEASARAVLATLP